jgi:hypothetical protein
VTGEQGGRDGGRRVYSYIDKQIYVHNEIRKARRICICKFEKEKQRQKLPNFVI